MYISNNLAVCQEVSQVMFISGVIGVFGSIKTYKLNQELSPTGQHHDLFLLYWRISKHMP